MQRIEAVFSQAIAHQILKHVCVRWVHDHDAVFFKQHARTEIDSTVEQLLNIIAKVFEMYGFPQYYLAISVFYADRFVRRYGVKHNQIFNLLIISALTTIKFWEDSSSVSNYQLARTFGYTTDDINTMESRFLKGLDFTLYVNFERIHQFMLANGERMRTDLAESHTFAKKEPYFPQQEKTGIVC
jgi:hypothetical protein